MKRKKHTVLAVFTIASAFAMVSCNSAAENVEDAQQNVEDANKALLVANEEYLADIENYRIETAKLVAVNDSLILDFKAKLKAASKESNPYYKNEIEDLENKNKEMKKKMDDYKGDGKDNWTIFKEEFSHDMEELGEALKGLTIKNTK